MTPYEYRDAVKALLCKVGLRAEIYTSFNDEGPLYHASLYPRGIAGSSSRDDGYLRVEDDTFEGLFGKLSDAWSGYEGRHRDQVIRKMALLIIRITADLGECTDAALRQSGEFDVGQIAAYGEDACRDANDIAGRGPFSITRKRGANGAPSGDEAIAS
mgnify:CR=1 FL=1